MTRISLPVAGFSILLLASGAHAMQVPGPLVETDWLAANADKVVILDVRADVKSYAAKPVFVVDKKTGKKVLARFGGHIPGARLVDYKKIRATRMIDGNKVTRMIPDKGQFAALLQAAGVNSDSPVVIVTKGLSDGDMTIATRMYWQMKYYGHDNLAILNGGTYQWLLDGRKINDNAPTLTKGNWTAAAERNELLASSDEVAAASKGGNVVLVDNRPLNQYLGIYRKKSYVFADGHVPSAKFLPTSVLTSSDGAAKFLPAPELQKVFDALKVKGGGPAITYCNSGHLASGGWFVMSEILGNKSVKLYDGSMHQWTMEKRPTATMKME